MNETTESNEDSHGPKAYYCEVAQRYVLGGTPDGTCRFCDADLTGQRDERLQNEIEAAKRDAERSR